MALASLGARVVVLLADRVVEPLAQRREVDRPAARRRIAEVRVADLELDRLDRVPEVRAVGQLLTEVDRAGRGHLDLLEELADVDHDEVLVDVRQKLLLARGATET